MHTHFGMERLPKARSHWGLTTLGVSLIGYLLRYWVLYNEFNSLCYKFNVHFDELVDDHVAPQGELALHRHSQITSPLYVLAG